MTNNKNPKVFISYSWTPPDNKEQTIDLANRLVSNDGVDVVIDVWDLKEGQDKYKFMEKMVNSEDINRVLIICNKDYAEKANNREGGVGSESMIISDEIYSNAEQTKFIPVIFEKNDENKPYLPSYLSSRIYIDLSDEEDFEKEYEQLIRNIFNKPTYVKPPLGSPPKYLSNNKEPSLFSSHINTIKSALINEKKYSTDLITEFFDLFIANLKNYEIDLSELNRENKEIEREVIEKISELGICKDDLVDLMKIIIKYSKNEINLFHKFFQQLLEYIISIEIPNAPSNSHGAMKNGPFYLLMYELFISLVGLLMENELFEESSYILHTPYIPYNLHEEDYLNIRFDKFNIENSINRLIKNSINEVSKLIRDRSKGVFLKENFICEVDAVLYYISCLTANQGQMSRIWFPHTCNTSYQTISILKKLKSKTHFNNFKILLQVDNKDELSNKIKYVVENHIDKVERHYYEIDYIQTAFNLDEIGSIP